MHGLDGLIWLGARAALVCMFPFSAIDKVWHWKNAITQTKQARLPGAGPMLVAAILVEGITPFMIVFGVWDRAAAFVLAGFCVVTAFLYHHFWTYDDFWIAGDDSVAREHFWQFLKNLGLVGGLALLMFAQGPLPAAEVAAHPLASSGAAAASN